MPIGPYKDFKACVRQNQDKKNPDAYCAEIQRKIEGQKRVDAIIGGA